MFVLIQWDFKIVILWLKYHYCFLFFFLISQNYFSALLQLKSVHDANLFCIKISVHVKIFLVSSVLYIGADLTCPHHIKDCLQWSLDSLFPLPCATPFDLIICQSTSIRQSSTPSLMFDVWLLMFFVYLIGAPPL